MIFSQNVLLELGLQGTAVGWISSASSGNGWLA